MLPRHSFLLLCGILMVFLSVAPLFAQSDYSKRKATRNISVGVGFAGGASLILEPPDGQKIGPVYAMRIGVDAGIPVSSAITPTLSFGYDQRGAELHAEDNSDAFLITNTNYFYITPGISISAFWLGLNIGLPMGGSTGYPNDISLDFSDDRADKMLTVLEPRIGAVIPVVDEKIGWLGVIISGGFNLNPIFSDQEDLPENFGNYQSVSAHLGLTWQFAIPNTGLK